MDSNPYLSHHIHSSSSLQRGRARVSRASQQGLQRRNAVYRHETSEGWQQRSRRRQCSSPPADDSETSSNHHGNIHRNAKSNSSNSARAVYGNYQNYYGYRYSASCCRLDPRLSLLDREWFLNKRMLDIGCNAGVLTLEIAMLFQPSFVLGVDIDTRLVQKATSRLKYLASLMQPPTPSTSAPSSPRQSVVFDYFPQSCPLTFGTLPILSPPTGQQDISSSPSPSAFPHNVHFKCTDWVKAPLVTSYNSHKFDIILALSITKWIHLNTGDAGLKLFFSKIYTSLSNGGIFILEPQSFSTYSKRCYTPEMKAHYDAIVLRPDQFQEYLVKEVGFSSCRLLHNNDALVGLTATSSVASKNFKRPLYMFIK